MPGFSVVDGAYKNTRAPNPACCSNPKLLCPKCALTVLTTGVKRYFSYTDDPLPERRQETQMHRGKLIDRADSQYLLANCDCDEILPLPSMEASKVRNSTLRVESDDILPLPAMEASSLRNVTVRNASDDILPIPTLEVTNDREHEAECDVLMPPMF